MSSSHQTVADDNPVPKTEDSTPLEKTTLPPAQQSKAHVGLPTARLTSISISSPHDVKPVLNTEPVKAEPLTQERLETYWKQLLESCKGDEELYGLINDKVIELKDENLFNIQVPNLYYDTLLQPYQLRILDFLRKASGVEMLQYRVVVAFEKTERKAYLPSEKFEEMASRNPSMLSLRKLFPDIDF